MDRGGGERGGMQLSGGQRGWLGACGLAWRLGGGIGCPRLSVAFFLLGWSTGRLSGAGGTR